MSMQTRISDNFCLQLLKKKSKSLGGDKFYEKVHLVLIGADSVMVFRVAQTKPARLDCLRFCRPGPSPGCRVLDASRAGTFVRFSTGDQRLTGLSVVKA